MRSTLLTATAAAAIPLASALAAPSVEPIPEYAPVQAVLLSEDLFSAGYHAPELLTEITAAQAEPWIVTADEKSRPELEKTLAEAGVKPMQLKAAAFFHVAHGNLWLRDYGPVITTQGFADLKYDGAASVNDDFPRTLGKLLSVPTVHVQAELDGGNLLAAGDFCFTSAANVASTVVERHAPALGCRKLLVVKDPAHAHIDMWAKVVARDTVLVNELSADTLNLVQAQYGHIPADVADLKARLDGGARQLEAAGMKVERLPMPLPYRNVFRTFANSILVNGRAIVPAFAKFGWGYDEYPDAKLEPAYEAQVKKIYAKHGYETRFVNADGLMFNGGGFHCVLLQIPAATGVNQKKGH